MEIFEAADLIRTEEILESSDVQTWCDLGCGTGTFTLALASLLPPGSTIYAIDRDAKALAEIPDSYEHVTIRKQVLEWDLANLSLPHLNGVLIANLLHYIKDQQAALEILRSFAEQLLVVEYEDREASSWIPYPVSFPALKDLLLKRGFTHVQKVGTRASRFGGSLYSSHAW